MNITEKRKSYRISFIDNLVWYLTPNHHKQYYNWRVEK
jgi:hypothetical protein